MSCNLVPENNHDIGIRRVSEISHINELRREVSGLDHLASEFYEISRQSNPDSISLDSIHKRFYSDAKIKFAKEGSNNDIMPNNLPNNLETMERLVEWNAIDDTEKSSIAGYSEVFGDTPFNKECIPKEGLIVIKNRRKNENVIIEGEKDCFVVVQHFSDTGVKKGRANKANIKKSW
ncbi:unnamed protein product [Lepeophtheirus salmonis]|uniref:(salmon louse) hypothetical protein n=1 Tax=Lepeophtheirus salmonis TaxID=72036 RepID=A0A7R8H2L7_LEPSM|nr:unnamed protein product [Lepeophtheirus salmonis]CAF2817041.1 unnamed protein product [Lepeophtheirus salmonis]